MDVPCRQIWPQFFCVNSDWRPLLGEGPQQFNISPEAAQTVSTGAGLVYELSEANGKKTRTFPAFLNVAERQVHQKLNGMHTRCLFVLSQKAAALKVFRGRCRLTRSGVGEKWYQLTKYLTAIFETIFRNEQNIKCHREAPGSHFAVL